MLSAGAQAPSFDLTDLTGTRHSLTQILERGPALLALYKISCPTCQLTMPYLERLGKDSLQIIGISQDDERATHRFVKTLGLSMPTLLDPEEAGYPVSNAFGITHVPSLFLVETDRRISLATSGFHKHDLEAIAHRAQSRLFLPDDHVPEWKAG